MAIVSKSSGEVIELWQFDVNVLARATVDSQGSAPAFANDSTSDGKSQEEVQKEIQAIIRQITASITFLPVLDAGQCTFNVQVYADSDAQVPVEWADSAAKEIRNAEKVQLRSFSTESHEIGTLVAYRLGDDDA